MRDDTICFHHTSESIELRARGDDAIVVVAADEYRRLAGGTADFKIFLLSAPDLSQLELDSDVSDRRREAES